jgi:hypothetical protein
MLLTAAICNYNLSEMASKEMFINTFLLLCYISKFNEAFFVLLYGNSFKRWVIDYVILR